MILKHLGWSEGGPLTIAVTPPEFIRRIFAEMFIVAMDDAPNFQTGSVEFKSQGYELTIRRLDGKSPAQMLGELRSELTALRDENEWRDIASVPKDGTEVLLAHSINPGSFRDFVKAMSEYEDEWDIANYEWEQNDDHR